MVIIKVQLLFFYATADGYIEDIGETTADKERQEGKSVSIFST